MTLSRDHGGGIDAARARWGGSRADWIDLSTGINPEPYALPDLPADAWTALPDRAVGDRLVAAARTFWAVPDAAAILAVPGLSAAIAALPRTRSARTKVEIPAPTYNEHAAAWAGHALAASDPDLRVLVHPNNPDGRLWTRDSLAPFTVIDESFCDITPEMSFVPALSEPGLVVLKSFGKFWGLAGLRLGFVLGDRDSVARLRDMLGPWPVSGPALAIGAAALSDPDWAGATRARLAADASRLDALMARHGRVAGGTSLFRLYEVDDAEAFQARLAAHRIWSRIFPYSATWLRLGLPPAPAWGRVAAALA